jgi:hypothetical protein
MYDHLREADKLRQEDEQEGEELKRLAAQYELEKRSLDMIRQQEANQMMADNVRQIGDVQKMKKLNQMQEEVTPAFLSYSRPFLMRCQS